MPDIETFQIRVLTSIADIPAEDWDGLANPNCQDFGKPDSGSDYSDPKPFNPCISHCFLNILEESNCATLQTGWLGQHLILENSEGKLLGAAPCYLKNHSQGEFVFDYGWADAFERAGGKYYPKLQLSVPFTPVTGRRMLVSPELDETVGLEALASGIAQLTNKLGASSAHLTFLTESEWKKLHELGFLIRQDCQFHWENSEYSKFEDFLDELASRKRKAIRKERRQALQNGVTVEFLTGSDITEEHWDAFFGFYMDTGSRKWGYPYLNREFFSLLGERMNRNVLLVMAKRQGKFIAGALNLIGSDTLYGRYWGCIEDHPFLHFEVCYYQAIDFAIENKLRRVEAGAQGAHKLARGYLPTPTYSAHWIAHAGFRNAIENYLEEERTVVSLETDALREHGPFKQVEKCDQNGF